VASRSPEHPNHTDAGVCPHPARSLVFATSTHAPHAGGPAGLLGDALTQVWPAASTRAVTPTSTPALPLQAWSHARSDSRQSAKTPQSVSDAHPCARARESRLARGKGASALASSSFGTAPPLAVALAALSRSAWTSAKMVVSEQRGAVRDRSSGLGCDEISSDRRSTVVLRRQPARNQP
jgi:hypothetical protein